MLFLNGVLVNVITGLIFGFRNMLKSSNILAFLKGDWEFNDKKYGKILTYLLYIAIQALLFSVGFIIFSPILFLFGKGSTTMFLYSNLSAVISSYFFSAWTLPILTKLQLISPLNVKQEWYSFLTLIWIEAIGLISIIQLRMLHSSLHCNGCPESAWWICRRESFCIVQPCLDSPPALLFVSPQRLDFCCRTISWLAAPSLRVSRQVPQAWKTWSWTYIL